MVKSRVRPGKANSPPRGQRKSTRKKAGEIAVGERNQALDSLRGLAILLMVVDHIANFWFAVKIEPTSLRMITRLSMPLFAILMGYFLATRAKVNWHRLLQVAVVSAAVNSLFYPLYQRLEILASLLVCYPLALVSTSLAPWMASLVFLYPVDPSGRLFDYPLSLVAACVAQGLVLRTMRWKWGLLMAGLMCLPAIYVDPVARLTVVMLPIASVMVLWSIRNPQIQIPLLSFIGRYPLTIYFAHYVVVLLLRPS